MSHTQVLRHAVDAAKSGNPALAKIHLQKAAEVAPDDPVVWLWMAWLADSPVSMIQCLENVVKNELYQDVARAGLVFAQALAGFKVEDHTVEAQQAALQALAPQADVEQTQVVEQTTNEQEKTESSASVEEIVEAAALEIVEAPSIAEALANEAPVEVVEVVDAEAAASSVAMPNKVDAANASTQAPEIEVENASDQNGEVTQFEPSPIDDRLANAANDENQDDIATTDVIDEVFEQQQESIGSQAGETEEAGAVEVLEQTFDEEAVAANDLVDETHDAPPTDFAEPDGTPANVWRAAQSDWFSLESDGLPEKDAPAVGPSDAPNVPTSNAREVEVIIPDVPSIRPDQATNVEVHLAEPLDAFSNHSADDGPVVAPRVPESNDDDWSSDSIEVTPAETVAEASAEPTDPQIVESHVVEPEIVEPEVAESSHQVEVPDNLDDLDPAAEFDALADRSNGQLGGSGQDDEGEVILVVDDSPTVRKLIAMTLEKRGYKVASAFDGVAAIKEIASHNPALILMDVTMPRLDGYQLCKLVKKHDSTRHIPVVMLTGKDGMFDRLRGRLVGCSGYITKPFVPDDLVATVEQFLAATKKKR